MEYMISVNKIDDVIKIAHERQAYYNTNIRVSNNLHLALQTYLRNLSFDEVKSLTSIMYLGKDKDYYRKLTPIQIYKSNFEYFDKTLTWFTKDLEIKQMVEKLQLAKYLTDGKLQPLHLKLL